MRTRSGDLLHRLIEGGEMSALEIRGELDVDAADFDRILAGTKTMSLPNQLCFATLLIERVPRLVRPGKILRNQALAAIEYAKGATSTHASQPLKWSRLKALRV